MDTLIDACPLCETEQRFNLRFRGVDDGLIEVYVACRVCPFEQVLRISTAKIEKIRRAIGRLEAQAATQIARYGQVNTTTARAVARMQQLLREEEANNE